MFALTIFSKVPITAEVTHPLVALLEQHGSEIVSQTSLRVEMGRHVAELVVQALTDSLAAEIQALGDAKDFNIVVQPASPLLRHKKLVVFDMDSTLILQECIDLIAAKAGVEKEVAAVTEAAMRGELDFTESLHQRLAYLRGVPISIYDELKPKLQFTPGVRQLCAALKSHGVKMAVLSGGFLPLASYVQTELGLDYAFANELEDDGQVLTGKVLGAVVDGARKAELLETIAAEEKIPLEQTVAVGDGSNDLLMMAKAGFGVAWHAKPLVQAQAPSRLNTESLEDLLYILGYEPCHTSSA